MTFVPHDVIDGDKQLQQIPDEEVAIKKYFKNIRDEKSMLKCGFQGAYKLKDWEFRKKMFKVMGTYKCYHKFEELGTSEVYEVGWFHGIHPAISNKEEFLQNVNQLIVEKLEEKSFEHEDLKEIDAADLRINYYTRKIYRSRRRMVEFTKGVVCKVKDVRRKLIINLLIEVLQEDSLKEKYKHEIFVLFGYLTQAFCINQDEFMDRQNAFIKNTSKITIFNLIDIDKIQKTTVGSYLSIRYWLQNETKQSGELLLQSVTKGKSEEETYILFNTADYSEVHRFVKDIEERASRVFNEKIKEQGSTKKFEDSYNISTSQRSYMAALSESTLSIPWQ